MGLESIIGMTLTLFLALLASWALLSPFFQPAQLDSQAVGNAIASADSLNELVARKNLVMGELEELEAEFGANKINPDDYAKFKHELVAKAAACLKAIDEHKKI